MIVCFYKYTLFLKLSTLCICLAITMGTKLFAQPDIRGYGKDKVQEYLYDACCSQDGSILSCGKAETEDGRGWDGLLMKTGDKVIRLRIGVPYCDEEALAIAEDTNGKIWIGGGSDSAKVYRAWLMCCNAAGDVLWERKLDVPSNLPSSVQDIVPSRDGQAMAVSGISGGIVWFGLWNLNGKESLKLTKLKSIDGQSGMIVKKTVLVEGEKGAWYLYGNAEKSDGKRQVFFMKVSSGGLHLASLLFSPDNTVLNTGGCILTSEGDLLGVGTAEVPHLKEEAFTIFISENLDRRQVRFNTFGGYNADKKGPRLDDASDIIQIDDQTCLVAGSTQSHKPGVQVPDFAGWMVDPHGRRLAVNMEIWGEKYAEQAFKALKMYSGDIWLCGIKNGGKLFRDDQNFAFVKIKSLPLPYADGSGKMALEVRTPLVSMQPGDAKEIAVDVVNVGSDPIDGSYLTTICNTTLDGCEVGTKYLLPRLKAGQRYTAHIPVSTNLQATAGKIPLQIKLFYLGGQLVEEENADINVLQSEKPEIVLVSAVAASSKQAQLEGGKKTFVELTFRNTGDADAKNVNIAFAEPDGARFEVTPNYAIPVFRKNDIQTILVELTANSFGGAQHVVLKTFVNGENLKTASSYVAEFDIVKEILSVPIVEVSNNTDDVIIQWDDDNKLMNRRCNTNKYELYAQISGSSPVSLNDIMLLHAHSDGKDSSLLGGSKGDIVKLAIQRNTNQIFVCRLSLSVTLKPGDNVLQILIKKGDKWTATSTMHVYYTNNPSTLYVVSIGIPDESKNLKYTQKDAIDIARLFMQQQDRLFGTVNCTVLTSKDSTRTANITKVIANFEVMQMQGRLKPDDVVLVFISTHGIISDRDSLFKLQDSEFTRQTERSTSVYFQEDILHVMEKLQCRVFILLDACHSAAAEQPKYSENMPKQIIDDYKKTAQKVCLIASCSDKESSYEHDDWQNGAFTKTLKDLLSNPISCAKLDVDGDKRLTLQEIFAQLPSDVNNLVRTVRKGVTQTPYVSPEVLNETKPTPFWAY